MRRFAMLVVALACVPALPVTAQNLSKATLDYTTSGTCTLTTPDGTSTTACSGTNWAVTLQPGWSASMQLTVHYTYQDDGLALDRPVVIQNPSAGTGTVATHESAAIVARTPGCLFGPCPGLDPSRGYTSVPVLLGIVSNDTGPTATEGTLTFTTGAFNAAGSMLGPWDAVMFINLEPAVNSVAAIPEPSTWALMALPLALGIALSRRRRGRAG